MPELHHSCGGRYEYLTTLFDVIKLKLSETKYLSQVMQQISRKTEKYNLSSNYLPNLYSASDLRPQDIKQLTQGYSERQQRGDFRFKQR